MAERRPKRLLLAVIESGGSELLRLELRKVYLQRHVTWTQTLTAVSDTEHFMHSTLAKSNILVNSLKETKYFLTIGEHYCSGGQVKVSDRRG